MKRWDLLLVGSVGLIFLAGLALIQFQNSYGQAQALQMPQNWILLGLVLLFGGGAILGFYRGTWQPRTGAGGGTFIFWILMVLAGGAILRGLLRVAGI